MIHRVSFEGAPSPRALQFVGDSAKRRAEIGADQREGSSCRDSDEGGNQRVLDGRDPGLAFDQIRKKSAQRNSPPFKKGNHAEVVARSLSNGKRAKHFFYTSITRVLN